MLRFVSKIPKSLIFSQKFLFSAKPQTVKIIYQEEGSNKKYEINAPLGQSIWEIAHNNNVPLEGACEGNCACGTCHVKMDENLLKKIPPARDEEEDVLQAAFGRKANSRLGCQVKVTKDFEGTIIIIPKQTRNIDVNKL